MKSDVTERVQRHPTKSKTKFKLQILNMKIQREKTDLENKEKDNEKGKDCKEQS